jgi:hypothetical protein
VGVLEKHDNRSHDPPYAASSDLVVHVSQVASEAALGHIRLGVGWTIDGDGILAYPGSGVDSFFELTEVIPDDFTGADGFLVSVNGAGDGLVFVDGSTLYADIGHDHSGVYEPAGTTATHAALTNNPHSVTAAQVGALTQAAADLLYSVLGHTHAFSAITGSIDVAQHGNQAINVVLAGPASGSPGAVSWRALVAADIPTLAASKITGVAIVADSAGASQALNGNLSIVKSGATLLVNSTVGAADFNIVGASNATMNFNSAAGNQSQLNLNSGAIGSSSLRWIIIKTATAEGGSNAGSNLSILRRTDAGAALGTAISIERATGYVGVNKAEATAAYMLDVGGVIRGTAFRDTTYGKEWLFGAYTAGTVVATGRIRVSIDGVLYDVDAKLV